MPGWLQAAAVMEGAMTEHMARDRTTNVKTFHVWIAVRKLLACHLQSADGCDGFYALCSDTENMVPSANYPQWGCPGHSSHQFYVRSSFSIILHQTYMHPSHVSTTVFSKGWRILSFSAVLTSSWQCNA